MRTIDYSPLFRSSVGFDRMQRLLDAAQRREEAQHSYPPYNIEAFDGDTYRVTMAVAGFSEGDLDITVKENTLVVSGRADKTSDEVLYLHRGLAGRSFERHFELADHVKVVDANLVNGLLHVDLKREIPEALKPRTVKISTKSPPKLKPVEKKAA